MLLSILPDFNDSHWVQNKFKPFMHGFSFLILCKIVRWYVKEKQVDEFDTRDNLKALPICKFCQIIRNKETLLYVDDRMAIFKDSKPQAQYHLLACSVQHIKNIWSLDFRQDSDDCKLIKYMKDKSLEIIKDKMKKDGVQMDSSKIDVGFHRPLSTSIDHLHMHIFILPFRDWSAYIKYNPFFFVRLNRLYKEL